jgi:hypothetical protein
MNIDISLYSLNTSTFSDVIENIFPQSIFLFS